MSDRPLLVVAAALAGPRAGKEPVKWLLQRRPQGGSMAGLWEFPGGKVDPGEASDAALVRELQEELAITVDPAALAPLTFVTAMVGTRPLTLLLFTCGNWSGEPSAMHADELGWFTAAEMAALDMPPADYPLLASLEGVSI